MNRSDLVEIIALETALSKQTAEKVLVGMIKTISETVSSGEDIVIQDFGTFKLHTRNARVGRNPATGETIQIPEKTIVKFKPAKKFKDDMNDDPTLDEE
jgi:DNA-binding protein HU-beta